MLKVNKILMIVALIAMFISTIINLEQIARNGFLIDTLIFWSIIFTVVWVINKSQIDKIINILYAQQYNNAPRANKTNIARNSNNGDHYNQAKKRIVIATK